MGTKRIAIVTGGGTGLGKAMAHALIEDGFTVVLAGRRQNILDAAADELGPNALALAADVTVPQSVTMLFDSVVERYGRVDLLVNNAGIVAPVVPFEEIGFEDWQQVISANLTGVFLCMQAAFRVMKDQDPKGGRIINNGSVSAATPRPFSGPYTAAKHGVTGLTKSGALDGRPHDIAVGQINIGNASTAMTGFIETGTLQADGRLAVEPTINAADVARAVSYMASLPLNANVLEMTVMATKMPLVGRG